MLEAAHRGYAYQDLLAATRLTDVLLGEIVSAVVDRKLFATDRFDDLTTVSLSGLRERVQIKGRGTGVPLALSSFTTDQRSLKLDALILSAIEDRDGPGANALTHRYRILLGDSRPTDSRLMRVLVPAEDDPGPFVPGLPTLRLCFDPALLWPQVRPEDPTAQSSFDAFSFLRAGRLARSDLLWFCSHAIVEVESPSASMDLTDPGPAEVILIDRAAREIGAGSYPNADRSPMDVAAALIGTVLAARAGRATISAVELLRRARLRQDYGAVSRAYPIDTSLEIKRSATVTDVTRQSAEAADRSAPLLVVGPPGQGKSWACQRVQDLLAATGWLVAEHYCFLGDADEELQARAHSDRVIGSLLSRLAEADPNIVVEQRPRFSASDRTLVDAVRRSREREPSRRVALLIDGLDHVTRILGSNPGYAHPSTLLAERIAGLDLPAGCVSIVFSQPGEHLRPLVEAGAVVMDMPGLELAELKNLAQRWHIVGDADPSDPSARSEEADNKSESALLDALQTRSAGNALYATYLCREVLRSPATAFNAVATVLSLPNFDGSLASYYNHLCRGIGEGAWIADIITLMDFAVSRVELREIRPDIGNRIDSALVQLGPVLVERATQGGIRVYHESFARFWLEVMANHPPSVVARLNQVAAWLTEKGLFKDGRAFRFLPSTLARAKRFAEVVGVVNVEFVARAIAAGFNASAIRGTLATATVCATALNDWPAVVRFLELSRAAETYEDERLDSTSVEFSDVAMAVLGPQTFASRLLYDGRTTILARAGLKQCAQIDAAGESAPWREYLNAYDRELESSNTIYDESKRQIALAVLRGRLRIRVQNEFTHDPKETRSSVDLAALAEYIDRSTLPATGVVDIIRDTLGLTAVLDLVPLLAKPAPYALALAEMLSLSDLPADQQQATTYALMAVNDEACIGCAHRILHLGVDVSAFDPADIQAARNILFELTRAVLKPGVQFEPTPVHRWLDACGIAARRDHLGLASAEALLQGEGWYRCWLRFVVGLCRAEASAATLRSNCALGALKLLIEDLRPFVGDPRACDLYRLHETITSTLRRALTLLDDVSWAAGTQMLVRVCDEISTTISGEMGGPLARDTLIELVLEGSSSARYQTNASIVLAALEGGVGRAYYSDIAKFHLLAARLALASDDADKAVEHWALASKLFASYGWRKDITIYALLDPFPALISLDLKAAQKRLEILQPLCERVLRHTDGKETRQSRSTWWHLLAEADPLAHAELITAKLFRQCNMPLEEMERARASLWRQQYAAANPFVQGTLRLSIETALDDNDGAALNRLSESVIERTEGRSQLLRLLISRADERPMEYSYSNSAELIRKDETRLAAINAVARRESLSEVHRTPVGDRDAVDARISRGDRGPSAAIDILEFLERTQPANFGVGTKGLGNAVKAFRNQPYEKADDGWSADRWSNAVGYRLLELLEQGANTVVEIAIRALADAVRFRDDNPMLHSIAQGLQRASFESQAVLAYTLNWTRSRARGGWLNFGGETNIDSLKVAAELDPSTALSVLGSEVERVIRGEEYGSLGVAQALVIALAGVNWGTTAWPSQKTSREIAFSAWDEAARVATERLPKVAPTDDPDLSYELSKPRLATLSPVDSALILATLAGLSHPGREQKRRSLLAFQLQATEYPILAADCLAVALESLEEPGTLVWLLAVIHQQVSGRDILVTKCSAALRRLCDSPHLTIRAISRELLSTIDVQIAPPPANDSIPELLLDSRVPLWMPAFEGTRTQDAQNVDERSLDDLNIELPSEPEDKTAKRAKFILDDVALARMREAEPMLPGFRTASIAELARVLSRENHKHRLNDQLESLTSRSDFRWPDAFIAPLEAAEEILQRVASGGRVARARAGHIISNPVEWETQLARVLLNDPSAPLQFESMRSPRPELLPPAGHGDPIWQSMITCAAGAPAGETGELVAAVHDGERIGATTILSNALTAPIVAEGREKGWRRIAILETKESSAPRSWRAKSKVTVLKCAAIELRHKGSEVGIRSLPIGVGDYRAWRLPPVGGSLAELDHQGPVVVAISEDAVMHDGMKGLGYPCMPLAPSYGLLHGLGLRPAARLFELADADGRVALKAQCWRSNYTVSDYEMSWPTLCGVSLIVRPDVFERIVEQWCGKLVWREFLEGTTELLKPLEER